MDTVSSLGNGDLEMFISVKQPAYINKNAYLNGAKAFKQEKSNYVSDCNPMAKIVVEGDQVFLEVNIEKGLLDYPAMILETKNLEMTRITEAPYDNPDGTSIVFDSDYLGELRTNESPVGPFAKLKEGYNKIKVWG